MTEHFLAYDDQLTINEPTKTKDSDRYYYSQPSILRPTNASMGLSKCGIVLQVVLKNKDDLWHFGTKLSGLIIKGGLKRL